MPSGSNQRCINTSESRVGDREELLSASMTVATADEIKLLFLEFQSAGVTFHEKLKSELLGALPVCVPLLLQLSGFCIDKSFCWKLGW